MRSIIVFILLFLTALNLTGQDTLIIGHPTKGGYPVSSFKDTLIDPSPIFGSVWTANVSIQLDGIGGGDMSLYYDSYGGGLGGHSKIQLMPKNSFKVLLDTNYKGKYQTKNTNEITQTVEGKATIIRKLKVGDTITTQDPSGSSNNYLLNLSYGNYPPTTYSNFNIFIKDTCYIAMTNNYNGFERLFFIKIYIKSMYHFQIMEVWSNDKSLMVIKEDDQPDDTQVYPNPCHDVITIPVGVDEIAIYSLDGTVTHFQNNTANQQELNVSFLKEGMYILKLRGDNINGSVKILKQ